MKRPALGVIDPNISSSQDEPAAKKQRTSIRSADYEKVENFVKILKSFGIEMDADKASEAVSSEGAPSIFSTPYTNEELRRRISQFIKDSTNLSAEITKMTDGLELWFEYPRVICDASRPLTSTSDVSVTQQVYIRKDSLLRILLKFKELQTQLVESIIKTIQSKTATDDPDADKSEFTECFQLLGQLKWMDHIFDCKEVSRVLIEALGGGIPPIVLQRELISLLPECAVEGEIEDDIVNALKDQLEQPSLVASVVDSLSNLNLKDEILNNILPKIIEMLPVAEPNDLPLMVKFILTTMDATIPKPKNKKKRKEKKRKNHEDRNDDDGDEDNDDDENEDSILKSDNLINKIRTHFPSKFEANDMSSLAIILDALKTSFLFRLPIANLFLHVISLEDCVWGPLDLWIIFLVQSCDALLRKKALAIFKAKVNDQKDPVEHEQLKESVHGYSEALSSTLFKDIVNSAEFLLREGGSSAARSFASNMYITIFEEFSSRECRDKIVRTLVGHCGSGKEVVTEKAFIALEALVERYPRELRPFEAYIKGILGYVEYLTDSHIRHLFTILCKIAYSSSGSTTEELNILFRKQLTYDDFVYKRIGIIGAMAIMTSISSFDVNMMDDEDFEAEMIEDEGTMVHKDLKEVYEDAYKSCASNAVFLKSFYTELSKSLILFKNKDDLKWISNCKLSKEFDSRFLIDLVEEEETSDEDNSTKGKNKDKGEESEDNESVGEAETEVERGDTKERKKKKKNGSSSEMVLPKKFRGPSLEVLKPIVWGNLDGKENNICMNFMKNLCDPDVRVNRSLEYLPSLFSCLATCEPLISEEEDNSNIDAALGCPLLLFDLDSFENFEKISSKLVKNKICEILYYAIAWIRNLINRFCNPIDPEFKHKLVDRLENLMQLQEMLEKCVSDYPEWMYPNQQLQVPTKKDDEKEKKKKKEKKKEKEDTSKSESGKKKKKSLNKTTWDDDEETTGEAAKKSKPTSRTTKSNAYKKIEDSFEPLSYKLSSILILNTEQEAQQHKEMKLLPPSYDAIFKVFLKTISTVYKKSAPEGFGKKVEEEYSLLKKNDQFRKFLTPILPSLQNHFETLINFKVDNISDEVELGQSERKFIDPALFGLIKSINTICASPELDSFNGQTVLKLTLLSFSEYNNYDFTAQSGPTLEEVCSSSFKYFFNFAKTYKGDTLLCLETLSMLVNISDVFFQLQQAKTEKKLKKTEMRKSISDLCLSFLKKEWEKEIKASSCKVILETYIATASEPVVVLETLITEVLPAYFSDSSNCKSKDVNHDEYLTLKKSTLAAYYDVIFCGLIKRFKSIKFTGVKRSTRTSSLKEADTISILFDQMVKFTRSVDIKPILIIALRQGTKFVENFNKTLSNLENVDVDDELSKSIQGIIKNVQQANRQLLNVCNHAKNSKIVTLVPLVPKTRQALELFVVTVKALAARHGTELTVGSLKQRNLDGTEIKDNSAEEEGDGEEEEEEESVSKINNDEDDDDEEEDED